jgi:hypothetical protein
LYLLDAGDSTPAKSGRGVERSLSEGVMSNSVVKRIVAFGEQLVQTVVRSVKAAARAVVARLRRVERPVLIGMVTLGLLVAALLAPAAGR